MSDVTKAVETSNLSLSEIWDALVKAGASVYGAFCDYSTEDGEGREWSYSGQDFIVMGDEFALCVDDVDGYAITPIETFGDPGDWTLKSEIED